MIPTRIDLDEPLEVTLKKALSLRKGTKIMRTGVLQNEDFPEEAVAGIVACGGTPGLLPKAISYGPPSDEETTEAVHALYATKENKERMGIPPFYINTQGNLLACARSRSDFRKNGPTYCYDTLMQPIPRGAVVGA